MWIGILVGEVAAIPKKYLFDVDSSIFSLLAGESDRSVFESSD